MFFNVKRRTSAPVRDSMIIVSERVGPVSAPSRRP